MGLESPNYRGYHFRGVCDEITHNHHIVNNLSTIVENFFVIMLITYLNMLKTFLQTYVNVLKTHGRLC